MGQSAPGSEALALCAKRRVGKGDHLLFAWIITSIEGAKLRGTERSECKIMCFPYSAVFLSLYLLQLYEAFTFLKSLGAVILVHAENGDLIAQVSELSFLLHFVRR